MKDEEIRARLENIELLRIAKMWERRHWKRAARESQKGNLRLAGSCGRAALDFHAEVVRLTNLLRERC